MTQEDEGSTRRLLQLCLGYFLFYVITGVTVKYFQGSADKGFPGMSDVEFSAYSTIGGSALCLVWVLARGWFRLQSNGTTRWGPWELPVEYTYIIPSGFCTAVIIPTTTLMYSLPISVMVAMVIMRGSVIIISRVVDALQIRQGILKRHVYLEENLAVFFALLAVIIAIVVNVLNRNPNSSHGGHATSNPNALSMAAGMVVLGSYICAYAVRIYIMNYFKNTRAPGVKLDNNGFFGVEQLTATCVLFLVGLGLYFLPPILGLNSPHLARFHQAFSLPKPQWPGALVAGMAFGMVSFFSVFIFMFKGRSATFAGLVNRLTSLLAGTGATLIFWLLFHGSAPKLEDWASLGFILVAVAFLTLAERRRSREAALQQAKPS